MLLFLCFVSLLFSVFFFFKQKTAYEMRISDWSSDVCSSDLFGGQALDQVFIDTRLDVDAVGAHAGLAGVAILRGQDAIDGTIEIGVVEHNERRIDRKSVV